MPRLLSISRLSVLLILLAPAGCIFIRPWSDDSLTARTPEGLPPLPSEPALRVLVIGDQGTSGDGQRAIAEAIAGTHTAAPPDLVLTVGDNFYPSGVRNVSDPLWRSAFEEVYAGPFWDDLVFFPTLGNHDVEGEDRAQIEYSEVSPRWSMPGNYYSFRRALPSGDTVRFLALDTNILQREGARERAHLAWVDSILGIAEDRWIITYGHHPLVTGGRHAPERRVREKLMPRFRDRVSLILSGHNHSTELLRVSPVLFQGVCGGGAGRDNAYRIGETEETLAHFTNGGWCFLHVGADAVTVELYNRIGTLRHRQVIEHAGASGSVAGPPGPSIDLRSYRLGAMGAFAEMVGAGVKTLALSAPMEPDEVDALLDEARRIVEENGAELFRETDFLVTDLFPPKLTEGKEVLVIFRGETLERYLQLKAQKKALEEAGEYHAEARLEVARRFGILLSYPEEKIRQLLSGGTP